MSTSIEWTDATWNPVTGCTKVSPGCAHCYIERTPAFRVKGIRFERGRIPVQLHPDRLALPLRWRRPRRVFVNSMSDLFHEDVPYEFIRRVFDVMRCCDGGIVAATGKQQPSHIFQVLTKRPERMLELAKSRALGFDPEKPPKNVWLGVSVENQRWADERIPLLLQTPAAVRFLSCEPLLGPVDLWRKTATVEDCSNCNASGSVEPWGGEPGGSQCPKCRGDGQICTSIDWIICGGESGPAYRPFDPEWARDLLSHARREQIPFFMKQLGGARPGTKLKDLPEDLRIREFPR